MSRHAEKRSLTDGGGLSLDEGACLAGAGGGALARTAGTAMCGAAIVGSTNDDRPEMRAAIDDSEAGADGPLAYATGTAVGPPIGEDDCETDLEANE